MRSSILFITLLVALLAVTCSARRGEDHRGRPRNFPQRGRDQDRSESSSEHSDDSSESEVSEDSASEAAELDETELDETELDETELDETDEATMDEEEEETSKTNGTRDDCLRSCVREAVSDQQGQSLRQRGGRSFPKPRELIECIDECDTRVCVLSCVADLGNEVAQALVLCVQECDTGSGAEVVPDVVPDVVPA